MGNALPRTVAEVAPTLADLKLLSLGRQSLLLLARLAILYPQMKNTGGLHKGNLLLPNDPYGLAVGYNAAENSDVRRHLLGTPWTTLVNHGYIVDPAGSGFFSIADEGHDALKDTERSADKIDGKMRPDISPSPFADSAPAFGSNGSKMPRTAVVINVLIASPSDVSEERDIVSSVVHAWNAAHFPTTGIMLNAIRWETHSFPASGDRPQAIVNRQIVDEGDFLIGIFGNRLGTPTGEAQSGTIEEIERFRKAGKHVALYFSTADVPRNVDRDQLKALEDYQRERQKDTLYSTFSTVEELSGRVSQHLPRIVPEVYSRLQSSRELEGLEQEVRTIDSNSKERLSQIADQDQFLLADVISELEDDVDCARKPRVGDAYRRPSTEAWRLNRNRIALPEPVRSGVVEIYRRIDGWCDVIDSGLHPNMGSMELEAVMASLRTDLPSLIAELRKLLPSPNSKEAGKS